MRVEDHCWNEARPSKLERLLLRRAAHALWEEDRRIAEAFAASPGDYTKTNQGLGYWLFETTLVYVIFKEWLRHCEAGWEVSYPDRAAQKADLLVRERNEPKLVFEAKWWGGGSETERRGREGDVSRLLAWKEPVRRYQLLFWLNKQANRERDVAELDDYVASVKAATLQLTYLGRFPTHYAIPDEPWLFSMAAIAVDNLDRQT